MIEKLDFCPDCAAELRGGDYDMQSCSACGTTMGFRYPASDAVVTALASERRRQRVGEGFLPGKDDRYVRGELLSAAICYVMRSVVTAKLIAAGTPPAEIEALSDKAKVPGLWPWSPAWWKPKDRRRDLVRAAALIVAEIERLDRVAEKERAS